MTEIPVLFVTFARPEYAFQTFSAIRNAKPRKLYFYSNKARPGNVTEVEKNEQVRALITQVDWECEIRIFLREEYVDIYTSLWSAYDWIFDNEEQAIILEEDCVPSLAFFDFCGQQLPKFKNDLRIWVISGNNFIEDYNPNGYDYFYSYFPYMYGWASWRDRWKKVIRDRLPYNKIKDYRLFDHIYVDPDAVRQALKFTREIVDTPAWDYRFTISMKCHGGFGIIPKINLVSNVGISGEHNTGVRSIFHHRLLPESGKYIINNPPPFVFPDYGYTRHWYDTYYLKRTRFVYRVKMFLLNILRKLSKEGSTLW